MISKIKKPVSILLSLIMVFSMFTIVPLTASAAAGDYVPESEYLTFTAEEAGSTVTLNVASGSNFQYDLNGAGLTGYTPGTPITLENVDDYVRFSGKDTTFSSSSSNHFSITGKVACSGNVMSLRLDDDGKVQGLTDYCFDSMFSGCTGLTSAPELPETELKNYCYRNMFYRCENLTKAPELPATNLANGCYSNMFNGCSKLTELPALPATTLATYCYHGMFYRCEKLTKAPELPATNLADFCYYYMFYGCKSLTEAPALPATNLANSCYYSMFSGCTSLTKAPELPATNLAESCYNNMFYGCKSLTELPTLPATTLARTCYNYMFYGCSKICISDQAGTFGDITYSVEYRIPTTGEGTSAYNALSNMFKNTGGEFRGTPDINTTYYVPAPAPETFKVYVKKLTGGTYTIENLTGETTVAQLKEIIADQIDIPATAQRLIFSGKTLENDKQLSEYNIQNESTIHLVISTYTVTWLNYDNCELGTTTVQYGATPSYDGETPTKAEDADYTYTFYGWSDGTTTYGPTDTLPAVTGEVTYTAVFDATPNHVHNVVHVEEVPAGCTEPGRKAYYCCDDESCELYGRFFEDEELSVELTDLTIHALGHDYAAAVTEPSCTEGGFTTYTCSRCGDSYQDDFTEALGHDFGEWSVSEEPSCTEAGEEVRICARCNQVENRTIEALGHTPGEPQQENYVEPTNNEDGGYDTVVRCTICNEVISSEHTVLPALDPDGLRWDDDGEIRYYEDGVPVYKGLVLYEGNYYYINSTKKAVKNTLYCVTLTNGLLEVGTYQFDAEGRMIIPEEVPNGLTWDEDGEIRYYEDGAAVYYGLAYYQGNYYYINSAKKAIKDCTYTVTKTNGLLPQGTYYFDAEGRMLVPGSDGEGLRFDDDGEIRYYVGGLPTYAGLVQSDAGDYYYINSTKKAVKGRSYVVTKTNGLLPSGTYQFDADGKMVLD